jgi:GNAT superfamily N-acetyltransferase
MRDRLASALPDLPRWVETRGMLRSGRCELVGAAGPGPGDFLVRGTDFGLFCVAGEPDVGPLAESLTREGGRAVICRPAAAERVAAGIPPGWRAARAIVHALAGDGPPAPARSSAVMLSPGDAASLDHVPAALREEIETALGYAHVAAVLERGLPVSFAYASYETETLWDVSIDTLESHRGRGLARACCEFLIAHMSRHGREPVWGALENNVASLRLAARLGFTPVDELVVFEPAAA